MTAPTPPPEREPLHQQIARTIRNQIQAGTLRDGEVMPATRVLAEQYRTSGFTITEAMKLLMAEGLIVSKNRSNRVVHFPQGQGRARTRPEVPQVIFVGGYAGSGKTELGRILSRLTGWPMLDKDTLTRPVVETALELLGRSPHDRESPDYLTRIRPREYEALMAAAEENLECGNSAILTAPFIAEYRDPAWVTRTRARLEALGTQVTYVWLYCDASTMNTYIRQRGAARDAHKLGDWPGYLDTIDVEFTPPFPHHRLDNSATSAPLQDQAKKLVDELLKRTP
jgi:DNA-binding transcriptional regulator YhcF (GntR family)